MTTTARLGGLLFAVLLLAALALMMSPANPAALQLEISIPGGAAPELSAAEQAMKNALELLPGAQISVPALFSPNGGSVTLNMNGMSLQTNWSPVDEGCDYHGFINGKRIPLLHSEDPCDPADFLAWLVAYAYKITEVIGKERGDSIVRAVVELIQPFVH
ncbi:MAG: hypothetical protein UT24_C0009G0146 [Candidatus Woesebacteria bacterium GW2011_GWB1_39_12]|uniref:Uncharacterized protein n=2 Tax=Candidatus Woeseibacteriota TaxID=1752722 RepID=A0A0G0MEB0_9BACT|nr:MAG: hypothetical protein UT23_C0002G0145 [Candidatus Woesebacteria bacterium GW2011_GWA1_39_12]KKR00829.1 MAG: hypothetical protein UT24_C0009G0146 [Candidatus Woesebacteria bacterium GW2011_GWB1_39_12]